MFGSLKLSHRFEDALLYATRVHAGQERKDTGIPYIAHLLGVVSLALEAGADEDQAIAALLHDVVEDQGGQPRLDDVTMRFGARVGDIVKGCTDWIDDGVARRPPWRARKAHYLAHLATVLPDVRLVAAADKLHNARTIVADLRQSGPPLLDKFAGGPAGVLWYYTGLVDSLRAAGLAGFLMDELALTVAEMVRLAAYSEEE